jgi:hypothetical protein
MHRISTFISSTVSTSPTIPIFGKEPSLNQN